MPHLLELVPASELLRVEHVVHQEEGGCNHQRGGRAPSVEPQVGKLAHARKVTAGAAAPAPV